MKQWVGEAIAAGPKACEKAARFLEEQRRRHGEIGRKYLKTLEKRWEREARVKKRFDLVSLQRVADWIARPRGDLMPDDERRKQAYDDLRQAIADGEFGPQEKPGVAFFAAASMGRLLPLTTIAAPAGLRLRMTPRVAAILALAGLEPLSEAWAPRASIIKWYAARQHLLPPATPWLAAGGNRQPAESPAGIAPPADGCGYRNALPRRPAAPIGAHQRSDEEDRRAVARRRREWRRQWIAKFTERQRTARRWIALVDLFDWCAQSTTTASLDAEAKAREVAYRRLADSLRRGEFERNSRSKVLYLDTFVTSDGGSPRCRLTREQFEFVFEAAARPPMSSPPVTVLNCCWLPRELARHWLASHGYRWAPHFEPASIPTGGRESSRPCASSLARRLGRRSSGRRRAMRPSSG